MTLSPLLAAPLVIQVHLGAALLALSAGLSVAAIRKGTSRHRLIGYIFVAGMGITALSSIWIARNGQFSWIHLLTALTLVMLPYGILMRRLGRIAAHRQAMTGLLPGLAIAGAFTLLPGRILHAVVFGTP